MSNFLSVYFRYVFYSMYLLLVNKIYFKTQPVYIAQKSIRQLGKPKCMEA